MGYGTRQPTSNDPPRRSTSSRWLEETELMDETALLLNGYARRCRGCRRATRIRHLDAERLCPDCAPGEAGGADA